MPVRLLMIAVLFLQGCAATGSATPKAVFVVLDGIPADLVESVATPVLDEISAAGGYARAYVGGVAGGESESPTVSSVGYASLVTGTWANKHNVRDNDIADPDYTYWDIFRIARSHDPALHTAIFSTWLDNRTKLLGDGIAVAGGDKFSYHFDGLENDVGRFPPDDESDYVRRIDELVAGEAAAYLRAEGPDLSWIYLQYTDDVGHRYGDSPEMVSAVQLMDRRLRGVWAAIRDRQVELGEDWLIVVTTDHGRDPETGKDHGGQSDRERAIWIVTNSSRLNDRFRNNPGIVDVLPSIAAHLGLEIPPPIRAQLDGRSFIDPR